MWPVFKIKHLVLTRDLQQTKVEILTVNALKTDR